MKFSLGQCVATRGAARLMERLGLSPMSLLARHVSGDDGDLSADDQALNAAAIASGDRLWVITEWDRSVTTILLPDEY